MTIQVIMPALHPGQREIDANPARFKVVATGRRWGKTEYGVDKSIRIAAEGGYVWWVAPTFPMASIGWEIIKHYARQIPLCEKREGERVIRFPGGGWVQVKSADDPNGLRGRGLDYLVIDEAAFVQEVAWTAALRPALSDRKGGALFISSPRGRNWFYHAYLRGLGESDPDWRAWQFPTVSNPYIDPAEVEAARLELPAQIFAQEYLAEFIDDAGLVFRNVRPCTDTTIYHPDPERRYVMGVDWAQAQDFTVFWVLDTVMNTIVDGDRFNQIGWQVQRNRLRRMADKWRVQAILAEANAMGTPNIEALHAEGLHQVSGFMTTADSKSQIIQALMLAFERGEIRIPNDRVLIAELESFEAERLPSGKWRYQAPAGMHDDTVIALALTWWAAQQRWGIVRPR